MIPNLYMGNSWKSPSAHFKQVVWGSRWVSHFIPIIQPNRGDPFWSLKYQGVVRTRSEACCNALGSCPSERPDWNLQEKNGIDFIIHKITSLQVIPTMTFQNTVVEATRRRRKRRKRGGGDEADIKSNNPHLTGGEKLRFLQVFVVFCLFKENKWMNLGFRYNYNKNLNSILRGLFWVFKALAFHYAG